MKKRRLLSFLVLLMIAVTSAWAQEKVAYAVWDSDATTLTFKYDANKPNSNAWVLNTRTTRPGWYNRIGSLTKVVFDASFADARPTSFYYWFYGCTNLTSIEGVTNLNASEVTNSDRMFYNCGSLASVTLPAGLTTIGIYAFRNCSSLASVNIPESVTTIGNNAFQSCSSLTEPLYNSKLFVFMPTSKEGTYDVPDGITTIASSAFRSCSKLTKITIPESVTTVGNSAFYGCTGLTEPVYNSTLFACMPVTSTGSYTIPDGIKTVAPYAFYGCSSLTNVIIPEGVTSIGLYAFQGCSSLTGVSLPASTESIGNYVFADCNVLADVYVNAVTPPALEGYLTYDFTGKIYVPLESVEAYRSADNWRAYAGQIIDNLPRVNWATGANTENWTITVDGEVITAGETPVTAGKTVTVEYSGTRMVDLRAAVTLERQGNKWTFAMPDKPATLNSILGEASVDGKLYSTFNDAINASEYGSTVKLEYDVVLPYNVYIGNQMTLDLNGYAISASDEYCHFYLYPWNKLTVTDTSKEQKGGFKIKIEAEPYSSDRKLQLELMAGRYVFTADEINTNGYNGYGYLAENINTDGSPDADGYISNDIVAAFEGPKGLELCYTHGAPESFCVGMIYLREGKLVEHEYEMYHALVDEEIPVWKKDFETMKKLYLDDDSHAHKYNELTKWTHCYIDYDNEWIWLRDKDDKNGAFFIRKDGKFRLVDVENAHQMPTSCQKDGICYLKFSGSAGGPAFQHIIYAFQNGKQLWKLFALEIYGELDECTLNGKNISKEEGKAYLDKVPEGKEINAWFKNINGDEEN